MAEVSFGEGEVRPSPLERAVLKIGGSVLRHVAVGLACGVLPTACPAFVAINQIAGLARTTNKIYHAYTEASDRSEGVERAMKEAGKEAVSTSVNRAILDGTNEDMQSVATAAGTAFAIGVGNSFGADPETVRAIATTTASQAMAGGVEGIVSWGVQETVG